MKFKLPTGFELPAGVEPGQEFDAVVTLNLGEDGSVSVVALDGAPISDVDDDEEADEASEPSPAAEADFVDAVASDLAAQSMG